MHRFGGVYADLDLVPLSPLQDHLPILHRDRSSDPNATAYLGYMGDLPYDPRNSDSIFDLILDDYFQSDQLKKDILSRIKQGFKGAKENFGSPKPPRPDNEDHSVPNAFMISTRPGHPFWIQAMDYVKNNLSDEELIKQPEFLTGPVALKKLVESWGDHKSKRIRQKLGILDEVVILQHGEVRDPSRIRYYTHQSYGILRPS